MDAKVVITVGGWFDSLPPVTKKYVRGLVNKNSLKHGWDVKFADQRGALHLTEFDAL